MAFRESSQSSRKPRTKRHAQEPRFDDLIGRQDDAGEVLWYGTDHLGSVRTIFDNSGDIESTVDYDAFGGFLGGVPVDRYAYTGREWDETLGLQYSRARMYDTENGRWMGEDPIGFAAGDANLGRYVGNQPTGATDPSGMQPPQIRRRLPAPAIADNTVVAPHAQFIHELAKLRADGVTSADAAAAADSYRIQRHIDAYNAKRSDFILSPSEIDENSRALSAGVDAVILVMLKYHPDAAKMLRRLERAGLKIELTRTASWWRDTTLTGQTLELAGLRGLRYRSARSVLSTSACEGVTSAVETEWAIFRPIRFQWTSSLTVVGGERYTTVREAADALYAKLKETFANKSLVEQWLSGMGRLFGRNFEEALGQLGPDEAGGYADLFEEWEAQIAASAEVTAQNIGRKATDKALNGGVGIFLLATTVRDVRKACKAQGVVSNSVKPSRWAEVKADALRSQARQVHSQAYTSLNAEGRRLAVRTGDSSRQTMLDIHHRIPLEYRHLFEDDPNRLSNLIGLHKNVHAEISGLWSAFRYVHPNPTQSQIVEFAMMIDRGYGSYYNTLRTNSAFPTFR